MIRLVGRHVDLITRAAGAAGAADGDRNVDGGFAPEPECAGHGKPAVAAAAADALRVDAVCAVGMGYDRLRHVERVDRDHAGVSAAAAEPADADAHRGAVADSHRHCTGESTIAAAAADGLGEDGVRAEARGLDIASVGDLDQFPVAAEPPAPPTEIAKAPAGTLGNRDTDGACDGETAIAAAAADALREDAVGTAAEEFDDGLVIDHGHCRVARGDGTGIVDFDLAAIAADAARAAHGNRDSDDAAGARERRAAIAAAAADALREYAARPYCPWS